MMRLTAIKVKDPKGVAIPNFWAHADAENPVDGSRAFKGDGNGYADCIPLTSGGIRFVCIANGHQMVCGQVMQSPSPDAKQFPVNTDAGGVLTLVLPFEP